MPSPRLLLVVARLVALGLLLALPAVAPRSLPAQIQEEPGDTVDFTANLWLDGTVYWRFQPRWRFDADAYYRTLVSGADGLTSVGVRPEIEFTPGFLDLLAGINIRFNDDADGVNNWELRPYFGFKLEGTPWRWLVVRNYSRMEYRSFHYTGSDSTESEWRFRTRFEAKAQVKGERFTADRSWFVQTDAEFFVDMGDPVPERFASRVRVRLGTEYRHSFSWRYEAWIFGDFNRSTQVSELDALSLWLRLRVRYFPPVNLR